MGAAKAVLSPSPMLDARYWMLDVIVVLVLVLDIGYWMFDVGYSILDFRARAGC